jgi:hypothetical protein
MNREISEPRDAQRPPKKNFCRAKFPLKFINNAIFNINFKNFHSNSRSTRCPGDAKFEKKKKKKKKKEV